MGNEDAYNRRSADNRAYDRRVFDAEQGKRNRDVERKRIAVMKEQTVELAALRVAIEALLERLPTQAGDE